MIRPGSECTQCSSVPMGADPYEPWVVACAHLGEYVIRVWEHNFQLGPPFFSTDGPMNDQHLEDCPLDGCATCRTTDFLTMGEATTELRDREPELSALLTAPPS